MNVEFDINETGTFNVVYNASRSIPNETVTVSSGKLILHPPVGDYTIYSITITNVADSNCTYTYNPDIEIDCLAPCGCSQQNFTILSVTNTSGSTYTVIFDACRVNPIHYEIFDGGTMVLSGDVPIASNPFTMNLSSITTNGTHKLKLSSPNCAGTAELNFEVIHNGGGGNPTTLTQISCTTLDNFFNTNSSTYSGNYTSVVYKDEFNYYLKESGSINKDSVISIMSCTKTITAVVVFKLRELGLLDLNIPISTYIPSFLGYGAKANITLKMILGHTTGLPADTPYEQDGSSTVLSAANLIGQNSSLSFTPGTQVLYSSAGYQLAAAICESVSGQSFKTLCNTYVFSPLSITNYRWTTTPNLGSGDSTANNPIAGYGLSMSAWEYSKFVKSLSGYGIQLINTNSKTLMFSDATNNIDGYFGHGVLRRNAAGGGNSIDIHMIGASGCYGFINADTSYSGVIWNSSGVGNVGAINESFSSYTHDNIGSCGGVVQAKELIFVVNATGVALDFNAPERHYISNNQVQLITDALTGANSEAVDAIRLPFIWGEYNPSNGVYRNAQLGEAINWVRGLRPLSPPKIDLLFVPISYGNDTRIPANELAVDNNQNLQDCTYNSLFTTVPSYYSPTATTLIGQALDSLIPYLQANHGTSIRMMEFAAGQSEEHYMPYTSQYAGGQCGSVFSGIGDYSTGASLPAWRSYLLGRFGLGVLPFNINGSAHTAASAPIPNVGVTAGNNNNMDYSQQAYRELFRFYSQGIFGIWKRFHDKVKSLSSFKTGYVIPDLLNEQGTKWIFHGGTIWLAMKYADQFYHTYNISPSQWEANLWGADVQLGSFPNQGKLPAIEFDNFDAGATNGGNLNTAHVSSVIERFIKNGGKVVHTALGWTTNQMNQWKTLVKAIKNTVASPSFVIENRSTATVVNVDSNAIFNNPYVYEQAWVSAGNSTGSAAYNAVPVNISINNNGNVDGFWLEGGIPVPGSGGSGGSGGGTSASVQRTAKINIVKTGSTYSDTTSDTDGIFVAYYYVNNVPYKDGSGNRAKFLNESFTAGIPITVSKAFVNPAYFPDWNSMENNMNIAAFSGGTPAAINSYEQHSFITT